MSEICKYILYTKIFKAEISERLTRRLCNVGKQVESKGGNFHKQHSVESTKILHWNLSIQEDMLIIRAHTPQSKYLLYVKLFLLYLLRLFWLYKHVQPVLAVCPLNLLR